MGSDEDGTPVSANSRTRSSPGDSSSDDASDWRKASAKPKPKPKAKPESPRMKKLETRSPQLRDGRAGFEKQSSRGAKSSREAKSGRSPVQQNGSHGINRSPALRKSPFAATKRGKKRKKIASKQLAAAQSKQKRSSAQAKPPSLAFSPLSPLSTTSSSQRSQHDDEIDTGGKRNISRLEACEMRLTPRGSRSIRAAGVSNPPASAGCPDWTAAKGALDLPALSQLLSKKRSSAADRGHWRLASSEKETYTTFPHQKNDTSHFEMIDPYADD